MLPDDAAVQEAVLGWKGGIAAALSRGSVVVDMSCSNPTGTKELGERLARRGVGLVDAPVSGGVARAEEGTLTLMVGGDDENAVGRARPVLEVLGERLFRTGPLGSGHAMKALNNLVGGTTYAVVVEALVIGQRFGLGPRTMIDVMNASTGRSFNTEHVVKEHVLTGTYGTGFALGLLAKDVGIAATLAEAAGDRRPALRARQPALCGSVGRPRPGRGPLRGAHAVVGGEARPECGGRRVSRISERAAAGTMTKQERVYRAIRERILSGAYGPGYRVVIDPLAEEFGVSALPVREAIWRLEAEGLVVYRPTRARARAQDPRSTVRGVYEHCPNAALVDLLRDVARRLDAIRRTVFVQIPYRGRSRWPSTGT